jgi:23S rRNA pseudouridine1911/1915/1917 synthase
METPSPTTLELLFEDAHLLVVNKPGGLPVLPDKTGDPSLIDALRIQYPQDLALQLPHRLDRPVSGITLVARSPEMLAALNARFAARRIAKRYWALVHGVPPEEGSWEHRLKHDTHHHKSRVVAEEDVELAVVSFKRLAQGDRYALLELVPQGGHFHQLRAQCGAAGFAIKGDVKYGARRGEADRTIALHARSLAFMHPLTHAPLNLDAPVPDQPIWKALTDLHAQTHPAAP